MLTAAELRERRNALGATHRELGVVAGLSEHTIRALESGRRHGSPASWERVEAALVVAAIARADRVEHVIEAAR